MRARWNKLLLTLWFNGGHSALSAVDTGEVVLLIRFTGGSFWKRSWNSQLDEF